MRRLPDPTQRQRDLIGLPSVSFLFTTEQVATMLHVSESRLFSHFFWLDGREFGSAPRDKIRAINIAPRDQTPVWRVEEKEFIRWAIAVGFRTYEEGYGSSK